MGSQLVTSEDAHCYRHCVVDVLHCFNVTQFSTSNIWVLNTNLTVNNNRFFSLPSLNALTHIGPTTGTRSKSIRYTGVVKVVFLPLVWGLFPPFNGASYSCFRRWRDSVAGVLCPRTAIVTCLARSAEMPVYPAGWNSGTGMLHWIFHCRYCVTSARQEGWKRFNFSSIRRSLEV